MKEIIEETKGKKIPSWPEVPITERTNKGILGQINHQVSTLDNKSASTASEFDKVSREKWSSNERKGRKLCINYCKIQIPRKWTSLCLEVGLNIYRSLNETMKMRKGQIKTCVGVLV